MDQVPVAILEKQGFLDPLLTIEDKDNLILNNPVFDDLHIPVTSVKVPAAKAPSWVDFKGTQVLGFGDQAVEANEEIVYFTVQLPHTWKEGSDLGAHVHWCVESAVTADVIWKLSYSWANIYGLFPSETVTTITGSSEGGEAKHIISLLPTLDGSNKTLSSMLLCCLSRNSSEAGDTLTDVDALLLEVDFHYQIHRFGSRYAGGN